MKIFYSDAYVLALPEGHRFPMQKYAMLKHRVLHADLMAEHALLTPAPVDDQAILRAHDWQYLTRVKSGELSAGEIRRIGFPWSPAMVERSRRSSGGTVEACRAALESGIAVNLAGGTHHAGRDYGEGFCVLNDSPIAARAMQAEGRIRRVLIIDCDVHQGNGTALICAGDETIFTFSIHGAKNFPFQKAQSDLDIELEDRATDEVYLAALTRGLQHAFDAAHPELVIYLAGADPFSDDRFGRLALSKAGLLQRDRLVFESCLAVGLPLVVTMAGGYARQISDTVDIQFQTVSLAATMSHRF